MKRMNTLLVAIVATLFAGTVLTSCGGSDPKKVAQTAVEAELAGDFEKLYSLLSIEDRDAVTLDNFNRHYSIPGDLADAMNLIPEVKEAIKVEKFESQINGEAAIVTYFITLPDFSKMGALSIADALELLSVKGRKLSDMPEAIRQKIIDSIKTNGVSTISQARQVQLKREGDEWKVYMGLSAQIQNSKRISTVYDMAPVVE
ncbi:MAG: hypothetical protein PUK66_01325 [Bacteroidales bacterium]|uniref:hypothetical protein n=1 Tax=Porphyromonas sp. TaxID=1924944 RepID=UPI00297BACC2|nr:hypothetical protein [Porphyromonas sp.]MDD7437473.1 hypothetical protein [Bacteroidales bacterium]MDY3067504.1 hypothetical protein [Porphyromonas sp.]